MSDTPVPVFDALHVPPAALDQGGVEIMRAVIVDGALHVSLLRAFDDPEAFGMMIADITRHVGRIYADKFPEAQTIERIRSITTPRWTRRPIPAPPVR